MLSSNQQLPLEATPSLQAEPIKKKEMERRDKQKKDQGEKMSREVIVDDKLC